MRRIRYFLCAAAAVLAMGAAYTGSDIYAAEDAAKTVKEQQLVAGLKAAKDTDSLIMVVGNGGEKVNVSYHTKGADGRWTEVFHTPGVYGKNGATDNKKEGDGKTPLGTYQFTMAFGLKDDPGSVLPYHKITSNDYWVDDSDSRYYNQLVNTKTTRKDWDSAEQMISGAPFYNYGLVLNYNADCVPGKGSAIFLHCMKSTADTGSAGCVRIPEELMKTLLQSVNEETKIVIVSDISQLEYQQ